MEQGRSLYFHHVISSSLWPPYVIGQAIIFLPCGFFFLLFSSPNLSGRRLDVYHTSTHGVALVRIQNAGVKCAARGSLKYRTQKRCKKSPSGHYRTNLSGCIFTIKAHIENSKKNLLSSNISSTGPHNMVNFGLLAAEIVSLVWCTPGNFNGFRVLGALLHGTLVVGVSQTAALNRGRHLYSAGRPSRWALAHISSQLRDLQLFQEVGRRQPSYFSVHSVYDYLVSTPRAIKRSQLIFLFNFVKINGV